MTRQGELLEKPPRKHRGRLMYISDARGDERATVEFTCLKCGHKTGWVRFQTVTEAKKRMPCPVCNADAAAPASEENAA